jgi:hypothetical protein
VDADAEEAHGARRRVGPLEKRDRARDQLVRVARRPPRVASRDGREVSVTHLQDQRAREEVALREP